MYPHIHMYKQSLMKARHHDVPDFAGILVNVQVLVDGRVGAGYDQVRRGRRPRLPYRDQLICPLAVPLTGSNICAFDNGLARK